MEIVINPKYRSLSEFIYRIPAIFPTQGKTIYKIRNEIKVFTVNGLDINVKSYKTPSFFNRMVYTFFRPAKVYRAYNYAFKLINNGFDTPEPVAYIVIKKNGLISQCYFISLQSSYSHTFYEFGKGSLEGREEVIAALAGYTARLHEAGIYHRDYSPGNILFEKEGNEVKFMLVDINRMGFGKVDVKKGMANFARLWGKQAMFELLAKEYARVRKLDVATCTYFILYYRKRFWKRYRKKHPIPFEMDE